METQIDSGTLIHKGHSIAWRVYEKDGQILADCRSPGFLYATLTVGRENYFEMLERYFPPS